MKKHGQLTSQKKGFTLLDLVLALGLASLILLVLYRGFFLALRETENFKRSIQRHEEVYYALDYMEEEILSGQEIWKVKRKGKTHHILVHLNPEAHKNKSHFIYYNLDDYGNLYRYAWYGEAQRVEDFFFANNPGKNKLASKVESFQTEDSDRGLSLKLKSKEGKTFEKFLARRWPLKER